MTLRLVTDDEDGEPHAPLLGHNGPPPDVLPPSDARPSESDAAYWANVNGHIDELRAVAASASKQKARGAWTYDKEKPWGALIDRVSLLGVACDIEVANKDAKRLTATNETARERERRLLLQRLRKSFEAERNDDADIAKMIACPELAAISSARYASRVASLSSFDYPNRTFRFIAGGVLKAVHAINERERMNAANLGRKARKVPTGAGSPGVVVSLVAAALRRAGVHMSDDAIRAELEERK